MIDTAAIRTHIETDLADTPLGRLRTAAIADMDLMAGVLDPAASGYADQLARRNALLIDLVKLAITYNAVHVSALGQPGAKGTTYLAEWDALLRRIKPVTVS